MPKRDDTRNRLKAMLNEEREELNEATRAAAVADFTRIAEEYFDARDLSLSLKRGKNATDVTVSFRATRAKNFTTLK